MPASHTAFLQREEYTTATEEENSGKHDGVSCISCRLKKIIVPLNLHAHSAFIPFNHFFLNMLYAKISKFSYFSKLVLPIDYCFVSSLGLSTSPCLACRLFATRDVCVNHYHDACVFLPGFHTENTFAEGNGTDFFAQDKSQSSLGLSLDLVPDHLFVWEKPCVSIAKLPTKGSVGDFLPHDFPPEFRENPDGFPVFQEASIGARPLSAGCPLSIGFLRGTKPE